MLYPFAQLLAFLLYCASCDADVEEACKKKVGESKLVAILVKIIYLKSGKGKSAIEHSSEVPFCLKLDP